MANADHKAWRSMRNRLALVEESEHVVPFTAWKFFDHQGHVHATATQPESIRFSLDRRAVWNAVILEKLVEMIKLMQSQPK